MLFLVTRMIDSLLVQTYFNPDFVFAAVGDLNLYKFSQVLSGEVVTNWALFAQLTNWFFFFFFFFFGIYSLYYWPSMRVSSSAVSSGSKKCALVLKFVLLEVVPIGGLVLGLTFLLERLLYGSWVIVPLNFLKFNFLSSGGDYYGTHAWHWYMTQGFTVMLFTQLPFSLAGVVLSNQWKLSGLIAWGLGAYCLLGHKEFRFVLPVLPIALMFSGYSLAKAKENSNSHIKRFPNLQMVACFLLVTDLPMPLYMSMVHQIPLVLQQSLLEIGLYLATLFYLIHKAIEGVPSLTPFP
ncbi:hypothetical protein Pfo_000757 [Paulownia fortunei]|nr:hypothetical protein Pfo_000757 [Paulownia fortunei]